MLEELTVRNYALAETINLSFEGGLTILTGETGAGKSIIIGSIGFLLGAKADTTIIRTGAEEASVAAVISVDSGNSDAKTWLDEHDIETDDGRITVRRNIKRNGRTSIFIQNEAVNRSALQEFMVFLFDIHGQHEHESLLRKETHRRYMDRFAGLESLAFEFNKTFNELAEKRKIYENSISNEKEKAARIDLLNFAIEEIDAAALKIGESRDLEAESSMLASFEKLATYVKTASNAVYSGENSVLSLLRTAKSAFDNAAEIDTKLSTLLKRIENVYYETEDITGDLRSYCEGLSFDPARLEIVEERLAKIYKLKKKYSKNQNTDISTEIEKTQEEVVLDYRNMAEAEIEALQSSDQDREKLKNDILLLEKEIAQKASVLSAKRKEASGRLSSRISTILSRLGMPNAAFSVSLERKSAKDDKSILLGPWGADDVEFLIRANIGEEPRELARIASGGELSRIMLAIKTALIIDEDSVNGKNSAETLIFDEIDTGIGGEVALSVGEYLSMAGRKKQILCITHLASIAVRSDHHLKVEKKERDMRTITQVVILQKDDRVSEIARMLSGDRGETSIAHASEMLKKYSSVV
ncbi:MAG: DNA repair protein RecN [Termitinemataceae bacterium]|nr:MAG: DNA repair protein RecN [Termitinemataceae bacterium]